MMKRSAVHLLSLFPNPVSDEDIRGRLCFREDNQARGSTFRLSRVKFLHKYQKARGREVRKGKSLAQGFGFIGFGSDALT